METPEAYIVYKHIFPNGKTYIGITCQDPEKRWNAGSGYRKQPKIYAAILHYGWANVEHELLYTGLTKDEAEAKEIELIAFNNSIENGYNIEHGGNIPGTHNIETRAKISAGNKGKNLGKHRTEEEKQHLRELNSGEGNHFYGKHHKEETKAQHAAFMTGNSYAKGLQHTDEFKAWKSKQMSEKYKDGGNPRCKAVICIDAGGQVTRFHSLRCAAQARGVSAAALCTHIKTGKPFCGYTWRYDDAERT